MGLDVNNYILLAIYSSIYISKKFHVVIRVSPLMGYPIYFFQKMLLSINKYIYMSKNSRNYLKLSKCMYLYMESLCKCIIYLYLTMKTYNLSVSNYKDLLSICICLILPEIYLLI